MGIFRGIALLEMLKEFSTLNICQYIKNLNPMKIKNIDDEIIITIPIGVLDQKDVQNILDFIRYRALLSESRANDSEINAVIEEIDVDMRIMNKSQLKSIS